MDSHRPACGMSSRFGNGITASTVTAGDVEIWGVASTGGTASVQATVQDFNGATASLTIALDVSVLDQSALNPNSAFQNGTLVLVLA